MTWGEYVSDQLGGIVLALTGIAALSVFLLFTGTVPGVVIIILAVWLICLTTVHVINFMKKRAYLGELRSIMSGLDKKYLFMECAPKPAGMYERLIFELMGICGKSMIGEVSDARASQKEYREYVESWVHEIKTPITAAQLICRSVEPDTRRKLQCELSQIENHVERALYYARAESAQQDFIVRQTSVREVVSQALGQHRALLIQSGVGIETKELDIPVYTDVKWAAFLLGQLLQNSVRYGAENPKIILTGKRLGRQVQLQVSDNGIGIPEHELPRIFDRGFTGSNGRSRGGSTGMGLYICRKLAAFLQIDLSVKSSLGEGTCFTLTFPSKENLSKP